MIEGGDVDRPDVVAEITAVFHRYEAALVANDLGVLDELFWHDERTQRFGLADRQQGFTEIQAARRALARQTPPRRLRDPVVTTFGDDVAVVTTEFVPDAEARAAPPSGEQSATPTGRQSQTWVRLADGWRVVAAHVSWPAG